MNIFCTGKQGYKLFAVLILATTLATCWWSFIMVAGAQSNETTTSHMRLAKPSPISATKRNRQDPPSSPSGVPKVVGGEDAKLGQFKWHVALILSDAPTTDPFSGFFCSGSLIAWQWVLTAAHCTYEDNMGGHELPPVEAAPQSVAVYLGSHNFANGQRLAVKRIIRHELYDSKTQDNDLALIELESEPLDRSQLELLRPLLAADLSSVEPRRIATVVGWGSTAQGRIPVHLRQPVQILQYADIRLKSSDDCNQFHIADRRNAVSTSLKKEGASDDKIRGLLDSAYPASQKLITDNMICAGSNNGSRDACFGDSGGPLLVNRAGTVFQAGIVSWGPTNGCGLTNLFGVYVRLSRYLGWMEDIIAGRK